MAAPPTRVLYSTPAVGFGSTATPKTTPVFDVVVGDLIVLVAHDEDGSNALAANPTTTGSVTWTKQTGAAVEVASYCEVVVWTGVVNTTQTGRTVSLAMTGGGSFSFGVTVWRNHGGLGNVAKANIASGAPSLAISCSANSALVVGSDDWTATDGASRTWRAVNGSTISESAYFRNAATYTAYSGYRTDTGAAGSQTVGLTAPTAQKYSIVAVEVLGTAGSTPNTGAGAGTFTFAGSATGKRAPKATGAGTFTFAGTGVGKRVPKGSGSGTVTFTGAATGKRSPKASGAGTYTFTGTAAGKRTPEATGTGTFNFTGAATGTRAPKGSGTGTFAFSGSATGTAPTIGGADGSGSGAYSFTGSASGERSPKASGTGGYAFTGTAAGKRSPGGSGSGSYTFVGAAVGDAPAVGASEGTGSGSWSFTGAATGLAPSIGMATGTGAGTWAFLGSAVGSSSTAPPDPLLTVTPVPASHTVKDALPDHTVSAVTAHTVNDAAPSHAVSNVPPSHVARSI